MHTEISETGEKRFYVRIHANAPVSDAGYWDELINQVAKQLSNDVFVCIDLEHVGQLSQHAFNKLFQLAVLANSKLSRVVYTNVDPVLEERIALLTTTD